MLALEELEFAVQFLQLSRCRDEPHLLVQSTLDAVRRLRRAGAISEADSARLRADHQSRRLRNQIEGNVIQSTSRALKEQVTWADSHITRPGPGTRTRF
jgi:glutamine synthetase adenylyltransferase